MSSHVIGIKFLEICLVMWNTQTTAEKGTRYKASAKKLYIYQKNGKTYFLQLWTITLH